MARRKLNVIICGGETGGHLYPAVSIFEHLRAVCPESRCVFAGATGRMKKVFPEEMKTYRLDMKCFNRKNLLENIFLPVEFVKSMVQAYFIIRKHHPDIVVGVGGFPSGPFIVTSHLMKIPSLILETNYCPGIANKFLKRFTDKICVAFENMERFFPKEKLVISGTPIRKKYFDSGLNRAEACRHYHFSDRKPVILVTGGSLGSRYINETMTYIHEVLQKNRIQIIWQTGFSHYDKIRKKIPDDRNGSLRIVPFIEDISLAYKAADLVVSAAGAVTISELAYLGKAAIIIPSPDVSENHQIENIRHLLKTGSCDILYPEEVPGKLAPLILQRIKQEDVLETYRKNIRTFSVPDAENMILNEIFKLTD